MIFAHPCPRLPITLAAVALAAVVQARTRAADAPARAQTAPARFENVTILAGGHSLFAQLTGIDDTSPVRWVEAALLPPAATCAPPACDPDAPRATAHAATIYDGSLEFAFVTAGPFQRRPVRLFPGDRVRLRTMGGGPPAEALVTVADVTVTTVDRAADRLAGTGPAGARLSLTANRPDGAFTFASATVGTDGTWTADLAGVIDLVSGSSGAVTAGVDGVVTQASWGAPLASVRVGGHEIAIRSPLGNVISASLRCLDLGVGATGAGIAWSGMSVERAITLRDAGGSLTALDRRGVCPDLQLTSGVPGAHEDDLQVRLPEGRLSFDLSNDTVRGSVWWATGTYLLRAGGIERTVAVTETRIPWTVSFAGRVDLTDDTPVDLMPVAQDVAADWTLRAYPRRITNVDPHRVRIYGRGVAGDIVTVVARGDGVDGVPVGTTVIGPDGMFVVAAQSHSGAAALLEGPAEIAVAFGDNAYRVALPDVQSIESLNGMAASPETVFVQAAPLRAAALAHRDVVHGTALPGARITVRVGDDRDPTSIHTTAGTDGAWQADFADVVDLTPGLPVSVEAAAEDGYRATLAFPVFRASAQVGGDRVVVEGHPGLAAAVEVARAGEVVATAACTVADDATACTARVRTAAPDAPFVLRPDDEVVILPSEGASASLRLVPFSAHVDTSAHSVVGNCPPNGRMLVRFHAPEGLSAPYDASTTADGNGVCDYELTRGEWDLMQPGLTADLIHALADGHRLFATGVYEHVRLVRNGPVEGLAEPFTQVALSRRSAAGIDRPLFTLRADGDGRWSTDAPALSPAASPASAHPGPGETLIVDTGRGRHALPHTPLVGWWDDRLGAIVGLTAPNQPLKIVHDLTPQAVGQSGCHGLTAFATLTDVADPLGTFAFAAPPADACAVGRAEIAAVLPSGDEVRFRLPADVRAGGRAFLPIGHVGRP